VGTLVGLRVRRRQIHLLVLVFHLHPHRHRSHPSFTDRAYPPPQATSAFYSESGGRTTSRSHTTYHEFIRLQAESQRPFSHTVSWATATRRVAAACASAAANTAFPPSPRRRRYRRQPRRAPPTSPLTGFCQACSPFFRKEAAPPSR